jgi:hypothetical protein
MPDRRVLFVGVFLSFRHHRSDIVRLIELLQSTQGNIKSRSHRNLRFLGVRIDFNHFYEKLAKELRETSVVAAVYSGGGGESGGGGSGGGGSGGRLTASQLESVETPSTPVHDRSRVSERRVPNTGGGESEWGSPLVPLEN